MCTISRDRDNSANIDGRDKTVESSSNNFAIRTYVRVNKKWYCVDGDSLWILVELCVPFKFLGAEKNLYIEVFFLLFVRIILNDEEKRLKNRRYKVYRFKISFR